LRFPPKHSRIETLAICTHEFFIRFLQSLRWKS
jgi:hypothetical protein